MNACKHNSTIKQYYILKNNLSANYSRDYCTSTWAQTLTSIKQMSGRPRRVLRQDGEEENFQ